VIHHISRKRRGAGEATNDISIGEAPFGNGEKQGTAEKEKGEGYRPTRFRRAKEKERKGPENF